MMSNTSGKIVVCMGLAAFALAACSGENPTVEEGSPTSAGSAGGQGTVIEEVEIFKCDGFTPDAKIEGTVFGPMYEGPKFDYEYIPNEMTIGVGQILMFIPFTSTQNMTSGVNPNEDGKFFSPQGLDRCLRFNVAGTYPFFSYEVRNLPDTMIGMLYVK
jgi:hypothetical protein